LTAGAGLVVQVAGSICQAKVAWPDRGLQHVKSIVQSVGELVRGQSAWGEACLWKSELRLWNRRMTWKQDVWDLAVCSRDHLHTFWPSLDLSEVFRIIALALVHVLFRVWWLWRDRRQCRRSAGEHAEPPSPVSDAQTSGPCSDQEIVVEDDSCPGKSAAPAEPGRPIDTAVPALLSTHTLVSLPFPEQECFLDPRLADRKVTISEMCREYEGHGLTKSDLTELFSNLLPADNTSAQLVQPADAECPAVSMADLTVAEIVHGSALVGVEFTPHCAVLDHGCPEVQGGGNDGETVKEEFATHPSPGSSNDGNNSPVLSSTGRTKKHRQRQNQQAKKGNKS